MKKILSAIFFAVFFIFAFQNFVAAMNLNVHDGDLRATIMMVARTGRLNVSVDDSVDGKISVTLIDVYPEDALEIIAKTNNLKLVEVDDTYIFTAKQNTSLMQTYVLPIKYGDAKFLKQAVAMGLDNENRTNSDSNKEDSEKDSSETIGNNSSKLEVKFNFSGQKNSSNRESKINRADRVIINPDVNALVLFGTPDEYERAKKLLQTLDVELKQVSVEAKIVAIDKNASKNLGVEWMWSSVPQYPERDIEYHPESYNSNGTLRSPGYYEEEYTRKSNDNTGYGILQFGRGPEGIPFEWYYGAKINALVTDGKAKILSRPNVTTIQGHEAIINVGSSVPVRKIQVTNSTSTTSIEYRDAGIILKYTPQVNVDGTITATIHTEVSTPQYVADMQAYRFNTRSADTKVTVKDGEAMVIGGLIGAEEEKSLSKIPFLGDLPILGSLFKNHRKSKTESELMIFLTAHVLNGADK